MNNFEDYWDKLVKQNPMLARGDVKITLTTMSFKAELKKAYEDGNKNDSFGNIYSWL